MRMKVNESSLHRRIPIAFCVAASAIALASFNSAFAEEGIRPQTREDLKAAMQNEALTTLKYKIFAEHARNQGKTALAEILEQTAKAENGHLVETARLYGLVRQD